MRLRSALLLAIVGMVVGFGASSFTSASDQPEGCNLALAVGTLKGSWSSNNYMLFEDASGVVRAVDDHCRVRFVVSRQ